jgi:hypothetical protein
MKKLLSVFTALTAVMLLSSTALASTKIYVDTSDPAHVKISTEASASESSSSEKDSEDAEESAQEIRSEEAAVYLEEVDALLEDELKADFPEMSDEFIASLEEIIEEDVEEELENAEEDESIEEVLHNAIIEAEPVMIGKIVTEYPSLEKTAIVETELLLETPYVIYRSEELPYVPFAMYSTLEKSLDARMPIIYREISLDPDPELLIDEDPEVLELLEEVIEESLPEETPDRDRDDEPAYYPETPVSTTSIVETPRMVWVGRENNPSTGR